VSTRIQFFLVEALRSLRNNFATTLAATVTVLIVMFWLGVFVSLGTYIYSKVDQIRHQVDVRVYLVDHARQSDVFALERQLGNRPDVKRVSYVSKKAALARERKALGSEADAVINALSNNPLPAELDVKLRNPDHAKLVAASVRGLPGVDSVSYGAKRADSILRTGAIIEAVIGGLIALLTIAAVLLIANTIRLSIFARRREIEVMKLVGATNWFVRLPFMMEGMICGLAGAVLSLVLLRASYDLLLKHRLDTSQFGGDHVQAISFWLLALVLLAAGTGLGAVGSGLTMRRFLRV
jgi:cell division transport system permease protein